MKSNYTGLKKYCLLLLVLFSSFGFGKNIWKGSSSTDWNNASHWSLKRVPLSTDAVEVPVLSGKSAFYPTIVGANRFFVFGGKKQKIVAGKVVSPIFAGSTVSVPFTTAGTFDNGNVFTAPLSDSAGSFASPTNIGSLTQTTAGTISGTIPAGTSSGRGYRIRVVSNAPSIVGSDNGANLTINNTPAPTGQTSQNFCSNPIPTVNNLSATGTAVKWYAASTGGKALGTSTALTNGTKYYASQTLNGFESISRLEVTAYITNTISNVTASDACELTKQSIVTVTGLAANLPVGEYQVKYKIYNSNPELSAIMTVNTAGTGVFTADVSKVGYEATATLNVTQIANIDGSCPLAMSIQSNSFRVVGVRKPSVQAGYYQCDRKWVAQWTPVNYANGYVLEVSTSGDFSQNVTSYTITGQGSQNYTINNLAFGGTYYYRVRAESNLCGFSPYSDTIKFVIVGNNSSTPGKINGSSVICPNIPYQFSVAGSYPTSGEWSVFNETGSATITPTGIVTGKNSGTVKIVFTTYNGTCGTSTSFPLTISAGGAAVSPASATPTVCNNALIIPITHDTTGATGIGAATGLPAGVSASWAGNKITISGTPTESGTFNYSIPLTGGCGTVYATGTITVTSPSSAGSPSASPKVCANTEMPTVSIATTGATGIGAATGLPAGVSASWAGNTITISGTPTESGTFNYSIPLTGGCGNVSAKGTIYVNLTSVFDGANWSNGIPSDNGLAAEIASDYSTSNGSFTACSCTVNPGKTLTISPNTFVKIENGIVNNGTIIVESDGNLIQVNDNAVNQGNVIVKRAFTFSPERKQYNYVSSPVAGGNLRDIYPGLPQAVYHSEATNMFYTSSGANIQGRALAIKEPSTGVVSDPTVTASFVGVPFNGILKYPLSYTTTNPAVSHGYNLVGNPYPSNLDIEALYDDNDVKIDPTFSFWDNRGNTVFVQQGSAYNGVSYAKYNAVSGTGVGAGTSTAYSPTRTPNQFVKVGAGFMVRAKSTANGATLDFKNAYRSDNNTGPGFFGKSSTKDRYWLKLNTPGGIQLMTAVVYFPTGNNDFSLDDSVTSNSSDDIYTFAVQTAVAINGRAPFSQSDRVMVGVNSFTSGNYTISLGDQEGVFASGQNIYLKDHLTGIVTNLSEGSYTFSITAGQSTGRFELMYEPGAVLAAEGAVKDELMVYKDGQDFVVAAKAHKITGLEVYDLLGRMILKSAPNSLKFNVDSSLMPNGVYLLKIDQGGKVTTRKVLK
ncbi:T9SS type A sorting domain-containing protein [Chryseobacterium koreense]